MLGFKSVFVSFFHDCDTFADRGSLNKGSHFGSYSEGTACLSGQGDLEAAGPMDSSARKQGGKAAAQIPSLF